MEPPGIGTPDVWPAQLDDGTFSQRVGRCRPGLSVRHRRRSGLRHRLHVRHGLSGDFTIGGVECWTEWGANVAERSKYTPECVEQVTGVAPEVLKQLAYEYSHCDGKPYTSVHFDDDDWRIVARTPGSGEGIDKPAGA